MELIKQANVTGNVLIVELETYQIERVKELTKDEVRIRIDKAYKSRTLRQNSYIWALIDKLDTKINGHRKDEMSIYINLIKMARIKYSEMIVYKEAVELLKKGFRFVEELYEIDVNGKDCMVCRCYYGTSKFDKKEMASFIDVLLDYCEENEIDTREYERYLR